MKQAMRLLVIEDSEADYQLVERNLKMHGVEAVLHRVDSYPALHQALEAGGWDAILSDYSLPGMAFRSTLDLIRSQSADLPIILVSGSIGEEEAMDLLHNGLSDFVLKDRPARLAGALRHSLEKHQMLRAKRSVEAALQESEARFSTMFRFSPMGIGVSRLADGKLVEVNDALLEIFERPREEMIGRTTVEAGFFLHAEDRDRMIREFTSEHRVRNFQFQFRRRDGGVGDILMSAERIQLGGEDYLLGMATDITPLKSAERSLQASEARYHTLFEHMSEGLAHCRMLFEGDQPVDWEYLAVNESYNRVTGLQEVTGRRVSQVLPGLKKDNPDLFTRFAEVVRTGVPAKFEVFLAALNIWFLVSAYRPAPGEFVAMLDDVTDRKRTEDEVRESELRYRSLFENLVEGFAHCRVIYEAGCPVDFEYLAVNQAFEHLTGLHVSVGQRVSELIPGVHRDNPELLATYDEVARTGNPARFESFLPALGTWFAVSVYCPAEGQFVAIFDNITQRKTADAVLRASEARFQAVFQASPAGIVLSHLGDGRIIDANPAFLDLLGLSIETVRGRSSVDLGLWVDPRVREKARQMVLETGQVPALEAELLGREGQVVAVTWSTQAIELNGERVLVNLIQDMTTQRQAETNRRRLEEEVAHAQKLESLGALAGGVSHDMNNVLGAIMALASMLKESHPEDRVIVKSMDTLLHAAGRGRDLVKGLTDFARKDIPEPRPMNLNDVVRKEAELLMRTTLQKVAVELSLDEAIPEVRGDASSISNALMNLCVNALDAMPAGGRLHLGTSLSLGGQVTLTVRDTGSGMPPEVLQRAMEPFFTTKPVGKGTGLGLALVYGVMKAHGGKVELHSEPGVGTEIKLSFPHLKPEQPRPDAAPPAEGAPVSQHLILLVDDDDLIRATVPVMLETIGHRVVAFSGGLEAIHRLESGFNPDVAILDLSMPGMDGEETLARLRLLRPDLPIVLATGFQDERVARILERFPDVDVLAKPFTLMDLRIKLAQLR